MCVWLGGGGEEKTDEWVGGGMSVRHLNGSLCVQMPIASATTHTISY